MVYPRLTDSDTLKKILLAHNLHLRKTSSQHFLISAEVIEAIIALAEVGPKVATELGAGLGTLTQALAQADYTVRAIERDPALANLLPSFIPPLQRKNVEVVVKDLRDVSWEHSEAYQVIGNIPYAVSGLIIRRLTHLDPVPTQAIFLVQKEVALR